MLKKYILKLIRKTPAYKMPFWQELERKQKIMRLNDDLDNICLIIRGKLQNPMKKAEIVNYSDFKEIYRIAKEQQELLKK